MERKTLITQLRKAKTAHIRWRSYAQALISGLPMDEDKVPVIYTDCEFGRWYYGEGQALSRLPGYRAIDEPHERLHELYMDIVQHLFDEDDISFFDRLIGRSGKSAESHHTEAHKKLEELLHISERLLGHIEELEYAILGLSDEQLAKLY